MVADYRLVREALLIADGLSDVVPTKAHLLALKQWLESFKASANEREIVIHELLNGDPNVDVVPAS
jgi:hypothetical protein